MGAVEGSDWFVLTTRTITVRLQPYSGSAITLQFPLRLYLAFVDSLDEYDLKTGASAVTGDMVSEENRQGVKLLQ